MGGGKIKRGKIPRGIEVLIKKASVDPEFKGRLLEERAECARRIDLELKPVETAILNGIPPEQLDAIIGSTRVNPKQRPAFLGYAAAAMLAALGLTTTTYAMEEDFEYETTGIDPDLEYLDEIEPDQGASQTGDVEASEDYNKPDMLTKGARPDMPKGE
ncbi:MAG: hypothetical protein GY771_17520 [bacterium]|nr:hypothetical protein [bacterium]